MAIRFTIDAFDSEFEKRLSAVEWQRVVAFRNLPTFQAAAQRYHDISGPFYANQYILNKVVPEVWRFQMIVFMLHLHEMRDPADPRSGLTLVNFQKLCTQFDLASRGRAFAFLNILRVGGYLSRCPSSRDGRVVELAPTPVFMETVERWTHGIFQMVDLVIPGAALADKSKAVPQLAKEMRRLSTERLLGGWKPVDDFPEVLRFVSADGGWMLLSHCLAQAVKGDRIVPVSISLAEFGAKFGGSRSHLRRLLESSFQDGLLLAPPSNGSTIILSPKLVCAAMTWIAVYLEGYHRSAVLALAELEASP